MKHDPAHDPPGSFASYCYASLLYADDGFVYVLHQSEGTKLLSVFITSDMIYASDSISA